MNNKKLTSLRTSMLAVSMLVNNCGALSHETMNDNAVDNFSTIELWEDDSIIDMTTGESGLRKRTFERLNYRTLEQTGPEFPRYGNKVPQYEVQPNTQSLIPNENATTELFETNESVFADDSRGVNPADFFMGAAVGAAGATLGWAMLRRRQDQEDLQLD